MNIYRTEFFANCPTNGVRIKYALRIETLEPISVESILTSVGLFDEAYHEEIADRLIEEFGGEQTLTADHHGVNIETHRASLAASDSVPEHSEPDQPKAGPSALAPQGSGQ